MMTESPSPASWFDQPVASRFPRLRREIVLFALLVLAAIFTRFYRLGERVISHDEGLHVYYAWKFAQGQGYSHSPGTHGPLQFHLIAAVYLLLGDSDFTARLPHALASVLTVLVVWKWRRYLGRSGALLTAGLMVISPYLLYYGRYARNEAFVGLFGVLTLYAILRYLETGRQRYLYLLTAATVLHFTAKETAFIYTAQAMLFLAAFLIERVTRPAWPKAGLRLAFLLVLAAGILLIGGALGAAVAEKTAAAAEPAQAETVIPGETGEEAAPGAVGLSTSNLLWLAAGGALLAAALLLAAGFGWANLRRERAFDMLVLLGTFVLPQLAPFPVRMLGRNPMNYYDMLRPDWNLSAYLRQVFTLFDWQVSDMTVTGRFFILFVLLAVALGLAWDARRWWKHALLFWGIYALFYTSLFTNLDGFFTGVVGSLGHWLAQQGVRRGGQPWYYYGLIQIPLYEFLPALGSLLAVFLALRSRRSASIPAAENASLPSETAPFLPLLFWWAASSFAAYTLAGEKMPWLTYHIALPMILLSGWALGRVVESASLRRRGAGWLLAAWLVLLLGLCRALFQWLGAEPPFQGKELLQLQATGRFLAAVLTTGLGAAGVIRLGRGWQAGGSLRLGVLAVFALLAAQTGRAAFRAAYLNFDQANEYLVYAHGAGGVRQAMAQIETISYRLYGADHSIPIAYDNAGTGYGTSWPFTWYLRHYSSLQVFSTPDASLRGLPILLVDESHFGEMDSLLASDYHAFEYIRMVWPDMDYYNLTWARLKEAVTTPALRQALLDIWLNRDFRAYAAYTGRTNLTAEDWEPSARMRLYIRKDLAEQIWEYGAATPVVLQPDPYAGGLLALPPDLRLGGGLLNAPRGLAIAPDGSLYVADSRNHRVQHFSAEGELLHTWGGLSPDPTAPGTFNEPWDVAVSPDGRRVYVADTWNHRIQVFTAEGVFITQWGQPGFGQSSDPYGYWGPRGIAVDSLGRVYVVDTGNKRVLVYDENGAFLSTFGSGGTLAGQFNEPVGIAIDSAGQVYIADTWNQRIQIFLPGLDPLAPAFYATALWDFSGWYGQSLDNKPYLAVDAQGNVYVTDPDAGRVLQFDPQGLFVRGWGEDLLGGGRIGVAAGIAVDARGRVWVSDAGNNLILRFSIPALPSP
ncbi:MAG: flippase activity-associated protein Agl23 [Anaerolineales bacterium]